MSVEKLKRTAETKLAVDGGVINPALIEIGVLVLQGMVTFCKDRNSLTKQQQVRYLIDQPKASQNTFRRKYKAALKKEGVHLTPKELTEVVGQLYKSAGSLSVTDARAVISELTQGT